MSFRLKLITAGYFGLLSVLIGAMMVKDSIVNAKVIEEHGELPCSHACKRCKYERLEKLNAILLAASQAQLFPEILDYRAV